MVAKLAVFGVLAPIVGACASVTVYYQVNQHHLASSTNSAALADYTGAAAYDPTVLNPPPTPNPPIPIRFELELRNGGTPGLSITQTGAFFGFSIEMSVVDQVLGRNSTVLQVPFLNLMANLAKRAGAVRIRVGGNTQEGAVLVDSTSSGRILEKDISGVSNPTQTPPLDYTRDLIYMMGNISHLVPVDWFLGIPFNDTEHFRLAVAEVGQQVLGRRLIGLQVGNEPDLYSRHGHRPSTYSPFDYFGEFGALVAAMSGEAHGANQHLLIGPNIATGDWTPEMVWNTGFVDSYSSNLAYLAVEHYPADNCFAQFGIGTPADPQELFASYLTHAAGRAIIEPYLNSTAFAQEKGKRLMMFETNTASCGGFPGISDSFGAALWALDYGMQMAHSNFSGALFHVGGQNVFYNPFTPPPTNQSTFRQWTIGPVYYSALVMAEALGPSNGARVLDLEANGGNEYTPAYGIYEGGNPVRILLFNYITDSSGANDYTAMISIAAGDRTPRQVKIKRLLASSVSQKGNFTWAGQTFGSNFGSDGRLEGTEVIETVTCEAQCLIKVPAPGAALVFLTDGALAEVESGPTTTFPTTALTRTMNTATIDPAVLETSNGHTGMNAKGRLGSTSKGSVSGSKPARGRLRTGYAAAVILSYLLATTLVAGLF
ncbi:hypothetical protein D9611_001067 [Ephemerocybe angulata]|uniref:Beta-glucuronidase C-terminal domain-containing protein n=1 Tax=Ephemerocybe angulata TaxID=980116 RepID=A0A8H5BMW6_9AGAR|nr:hypothetical protein D9611_001067 [Tulosesus angulatus]